MVRQGIDQWFPLYVETAYNINLKSPQFAMLVFGIPLVATLGSLVSGYVSDIVFKGKRAPVAAALYLMETVIILLAAWFVGPKTVVLFLILIAFTANATHSILGTAAAMDIGGKKMAGFASGVIDSFQYYGGFLAGVPLGWAIDKFGWGSYFYFLAPAGLIGALSDVLRPQPHDSQASGRSAPGLRRGPECRRRRGKRRNRCAPLPLRHPVPDRAGRAVRPARSW